MNMDACMANSLCQEWMQCEMSSDNSGDPCSPQLTDCIGDSSGVCPPLMDAAQSEDCGGCLSNDLCGAVVGCVRTFIDPNVCSAAACPLGHDAAAAGTPAAADCGGQVYTECGSSCPRVCGQPMGACNMMCWQGFACPSGLAFNTETGQCEDDSCIPSGGGGGGGRVASSVSAAPSCLPWPRRKTNTRPRNSRRERSRRRPRNLRSSLTRWRCFPTGMPSSESNTCSAWLGVKCGSVLQHEFKKKKHTH